MTARQRKPSETFAEYRANLRAEQKSISEWLRGRLVWLSRDYQAVRGTGKTFRRDS